MGLFFDVVESPEETVILQKHQWGYWWLEKFCPSKEGSCSTLPIVAGALSYALLMLALLVFPLFFTRFYVGSGVNAFMAEVFLVTLILVVVASHLRILMLLVKAKSQGLTMTFHYFAPSLTHKPLSLGEAEATTVKKAGEKGYGIPHFWFSAYKIVVKRGG